MRHLAAGLPRFPLTQLRLRALRSSAPGRDPAHPETNSFAANRRIRPLLSRQGIAGGAWATAVAAGLVWVMATMTRGAGLFNDYYDYWAAARIVARRGDPYDPRLLGQVLAHAGVHSGVGGYGYSYPLLLAELMRPLALLPARPSAILFTIASLAVFGLAVALLLTYVAPTSALELGCLATAAGLFAPVLGSLYFGQVNLFVLALLALALRGVQGPLAVALASAVKLYPIAAVAAALGDRRRGPRLALVTLLASVLLIVVPNLLTGHGPHPGSAVSMFGPDPYWSNASVNGWLSRLGRAWRWLPVTATWLMISCALGAICLWLVRHSSWPAAFGLLLCFAVVAAPKNSLWNFTPLLITFAAIWVAVPRRRSLAALALACVLIDAQGLADLARYIVTGPLMLALSGVALSGALVLFGLLARAVATGATISEPSRPVAA